MTRIASLLAIPLAMVLVLGAASEADARGKHRKPPQTCETRIFQGDDTACFRGDGLGTFLFEKEVLEPMASRSSVKPAGVNCDLICAPHGGAVIGSVDRRGRWIRGELLSEKGEQVKFIAKRIDVGTCLK